MSYVVVVDVTGVADVVRRVPVNVQRPWTSHALADDVLNELREHHRVVGPRDTDMAHTVYKPGAVERKK